MPIYAGNFRNYRECGTFCYMIHLVVRGGPGSQFFSLESHPTIMQEEQSIIGGRCKYLKKKPRDAEPSDLIF